MKRHTILVVTERGDLDADLVILKLREAGQLPVRINFDDPPLTNVFTLKLLGNEPTGVLRTRNRQVAIEEVRAVYCRAPLLSSPYATGPSPNELYTQNEAVSAWDALWSTIDCFWMNPPKFLRGGSWRPAFLRLAHQIGIKTVPTLVTSDPAEVRRFSEAHGGNLVFRPIGARVAPMQTPNESVPRQVVAPTLISPQTLEQQGRFISNGPCLFQQYVEKRRDLRIVVVRDRVFAAALESPEPIRPPVFSQAGGKLAAASMPGELERQCVALVKEAGLTYGVLDIAETPGGEFILLELNPHGSFACFEQQAAELKVADALVNALLQESGI